MKREISEMVDILFKQQETSWEWPHFMRRIVGWKDVPTHNTGTKCTLQHYVYVEYRRQVVHHINEEISRRSDCRLLRIVQATPKIRGGVFWLSKEDAVPRTMADRLQRMTRMEKKTVQYCDRLIRARNTPESHKLIAKKQRMSNLRMTQQKVDRFISDMNVKSLPSGLIQSPSKGRPE